MTKKKDPWEWQDICPSFTPEEIYSKEILAHGLLHAVDVRALRMLQLFRNEIGMPFIVNFPGKDRRGVRSLQDQAGVIKQTKAAEIFSYHCAGKAFDVSLVWSGDRGVDWLAERALEFGYTGVGRYPSFVHVDTRDTLDGKPILWDNR